MDRRRRDTSRAEVRDRRLALGGDDQGQQGCPDLRAVRVDPDRLLEPGLGFGQEAGFAAEIAELLGQLGGAVTAHVAVEGIDPFNTADPERLDAIEVGSRLFQLVLPDEGLGDAILGDAIPRIDLGRAAPGNDGLVAAAPGRHEVAAQEPPAGKVGGPFQPEAKRRLGRVEVGHGNLGLREGEVAHRIVLERSGGLFKKGTSLGGTTDLHQQQTPATLHPGVIRCLPEEDLQLPG